MLSQIDDTLNKFTMYKVVLYSLCALVVIATVFGFTDVIAQSGTAIILSVLGLAASCYISNIAFSKLFKAQVNSESWLITALILSLIVVPPTTLKRFVAVLLLGVIAMASKYVFAWKRSHIFNPVAIAALISSLFGILPVLWWVGTPSMLPFVCLSALAILRKTRHFRLFFTFALVALAGMLLVAYLQDQPLGTALNNAFLSWPLVFFGVLMLTEPATLPSDKYYQLLYAVLVGIIFSAQLKIGSTSTTPQFALVVANLLAFVIAPRRNARLTLALSRQLAPSIHEFEFQRPKFVSFIPGQYAEWTLPHKDADIRGNRRTFTIASSPSSERLRIIAKFSEHSSSFKSQLLKLKPGAELTLSQPKGDFTPPENTQQKLLFIAGGIGVTPFISMLEYLKQSHQKRDIVLCYLVQSSEEIVHRELLRSMEQYGLQTVFIVANDTPRHAYSELTKEVLINAVPELKSRVCYISGPNGMVRHYKQLLTDVTPGISIKTDYFAGY